MHLYFEIVSIFSTLLALVFGIISIKFHDKAFRLIFFHVLISFIAEIAGGYLLLLHYNNSLLFNIYILINTSILSVAGIVFISNRKISIPVISTLILWFGVWLIKLLNSPIGHFSNNSFISGSTFLVLLYVIVLVKFINSNKQMSANLQAYLICIAVLLYYSGTIPTFGLLDYLMDHYPSIARNLFLINYSLSIFYYAILSYAFYLYIPKKSPDKMINNAAV